MSHADQRQPVGSDEGANWKRRAFVAIGAVLALFMLLNLQEVEVNFIFGSAQLPLIFALLVAAGLGALVGWAAPRLRSGRDTGPTERR
ncbi:MAG TPA: LapA family protein [Solirubrobacterales bacterium]|nr:LapA family protein [Solirubrobacterales bacterium]